MPIKINQEMVSIAADVREDEEGLATFREREDAEREIRGIEGKSCWLSNRMNGREPALRASVSSRGALPPLWPA
jgi:hypothetical protein